MPPDIWSVLPNLSIGVIAVIGIIYLASTAAANAREMQAEFSRILTSLRNEHEAAMVEREAAFRALEKEIRERILVQLNSSAQVMERVLDRLAR